MEHLLPSSTLCPWDISQVLCALGVLLLRGLSSELHTLDGDQLSSSQHSGTSVLLYRDLCECFGHPGLTEPQETPCQCSNIPEKKSTLLSEL